jgi:polyphosphate kinase
MRDLFTEANPFEITVDSRIVYHREFQNPEQHRPQFAMIENPDAMKRLTMLGATSSDTDQGLRVILESEAWRFVSS